MDLVSDPYSNINYDFTHHQTVALANFQQRPELLGRLWSYQDCYLILADLIDEYATGNTDPLIIASYTAESIIYECNNLQIGFLFGGYVAAARTAQWILETSLAAAAAILDSTKLNANTTNSSMTLTEFIAWLQSYDMNSRLLSREKIYPLLKISKLRRDKIEKNYKNLCKFSHLSTDTFTRLHADPYFHSRLNINPPLFNKVLNETLQTIDLSMYCTLCTFISIVGTPYDVKSNFKSFIRSQLGLNDSIRIRKQIGVLLPSEIPMTWNLLKK